MTSLDRFAKDKLAGLAEGGLRRGLAETGRGPEFQDSYFSLPWVGIIPT